MKFYKNKIKTVLYYIITYLLLMFLVAIIATFVFENNTVQRITIIELILIISVFPFLKMHIAELNQTVELKEEEIVCKNFIINGNVADGKIAYDLIESITLKNVILKPFSHCLYIKLKNEKPIAVTDDYKDYRKLWKELCCKCKEANPNVYIDEKIQSKI